MGRPPSLRKTKIIINLSDQELQILMFIREELGLTSLSLPETFRYLLLIHYGHLKENLLRYNRRSLQKQKPKQQPTSSSLSASTSEASFKAQSSQPFDPKQLATLPLADIEKKLRELNYLPQDRLFPDNPTLFETWRIVMHPTLNTPWLKVTFLDAADKSTEIMSELIKSLEEIIVELSSNHVPKK